MHLRIYSPKDIDCSLKRRLLRTSAHLRLADVPGVAQTVVHSVALADSTFDFLFQDTYFRHLLW